MGFLLAIENIKWIVKYRLTLYNFKKKIIKNVYNK